LDKPDSNTIFVICKDILFSSLLFWFKAVSAHLANLSSFFTAAASYSAYAFYAAFSGFFYSSSNLCLSSKIFLSLIF